ncbi:DNA cytosine methyltransferase [Microbacterium sp. MMO-113]|uniref:DNA cytosine methyltransferase n=1 Tax=Microbacterium sp. MMO-113 TaxID=3081273 RepID=UPI003FA5E2FC
MGRRRERPGPALRRRDPPHPEGNSPDGRNPIPATPIDGAAVRGVESDPWHLGDQPARPLRALGAVLGDLADLGYDAHWLGLPASDIGEPHTRFRIFIVARRRCFGPRWPPTPPAAGRAWTGFAPGAAQSLRPTRAST